MVKAGHKKENIGLYGFTRPVAGSVMPPVENYLNKPVNSYEGDKRNIAVFARVFNDFPLDYVKQ